MKSLIPVLHKGCYDLCSELRTCLHWPILYKQLANRVINRDKGENFPMKLLDSSTPRGVLWCVFNIFDFLTLAEILVAA